VDHTWVEERRHAKVLTDAEAANHPQRNVITRSLGSDLDVDVDVFDLRELKPSDRLLLCTDGLSDLVTKQEIASVISRARAPEEAARRLVAMAKKRGAPDNVTAVVVDVGGKGRARSRGTSQSNLVGLAVMLAAVLVVGVAAIFLPRYVNFPLSVDPRPTPPSSAMPNHTPTALPLPAPVLQGPDDGAGFYREEEIPLSWSWPTAIEARYQFSITLNNDRDEVVLIQIAEPGSGAVYTHTLRPQDVELQDGTYRWTVAAQQETEEAWETVARAEDGWIFRVGSDPRGDFTLYDSRIPAGPPTAGLDILGASVAPDLRVTLQPTEGVPQELAGRAEDGEALLWIELYDPIPENIPLTRWLFALDLDGDSRTGRPAGNHRISPDLGVDVVIGVSYNSEGPYFDSYFLVWNPALSDEADLVEGPDVVEFIPNDSRTLIGLAVSLDALESAAQTAGATWNTEKTIGRAAAVFYGESERILDLYPDPQGPP
jgi:hypothetical protein